MAERVLVVAPHPDDEAIGCGGVICLHRQCGEPVRVAFLTSGERGIPDLPEGEIRALREAEAAAACAALTAEGCAFLRLPDQGVEDNVERGVQALARELRAHPADLIYVPHPDEDHPDHAATLPLVRAALAQGPAGGPLPELRAYEVWTPMPRFGWVEVIDEVMPQKLRAVRCYRSQLRPCRYDHAVRALNRYRGIMAGGCRYAEAFAFLDSAPPVGTG
jgi:LmbE family N-acetylglucosaminyl deacetylase